MIELFWRGGLFFMLPLLAASLGVVAIAIERFVRLRQAHVDYSEFLSSIQDALRRKGIRGARRVASGIPGPVAKIWEEGLGVARLPFPLIRERMESVAMAEISRLERHLHLLSVIAQVAPLIGILGTVWGMISSFRVVEGGLALGQGVRGEILAGGICQALITTAAGLLVAIPATLIHHFLRERVEGFVTAMERSIADLISCLVPFRSEGSKVTRRGRLVGAGNRQ